MLILDWMKPHVITVSPGTTLLQCKKLLRNHHINRLPVVDKDNVVVGLISSSDLKAYTPLRTTGHEILEAMDIIAETKAKNVMAVAPTTIYYGNTVEQAAKLMFDKHVACLPVVNVEDKLVGILTGWDVFHALLTISGAEQPREEAGVVVPNKPGTVRVLLDVLKANGMGVISVLSAAVEDGMRQVKIRFRSPNPAALDATIESFKQFDGLRY